MSYISEVNGSMVAAPREGNALNATENEILEMLREGNDKGNAGFWIADVRKVSTDGAVEILYGESGKAYNIEQDVQQVIDFLNNELGFDVFDARKLAEEGKVLSSSGIQSDEAQSLWKRMAADPRLNIKVVSSRYKKGEFDATDQKLALDFREEQEDD